MILGIFGLIFDGKVRGRSRERGVGVGGVRGEAGYNQPVSTLAKFPVHHSFERYLP